MTLLTDQLNSRIVVKTSTRVKIITLSRQPMKPVSNGIVEEPTTTLHQEEPTHKQALTLLINSPKLYGKVPLVRRSDLVSITTSLLLGIAQLETIQTLAKNSRIMYVMLDVQNGGLQIQLTNAIMTNRSTNITN